MVTQSSTPIIPLPPTIASGRAYLHQPEGVGHGFSNFLVFLSIFWSSSFVQSTIPAPYWMMETALEFITALMVLPPFSLDLRIFFTLRKYSFLTSSFISRCFIPSISSTPRYLYPSSSSFIPLICRLSGSVIPSECVSLPLFIISIAHLFIPNSIRMSVVTTRMVWTRVSTWFWFLPYTLMSSINSRWLIAPFPLPRS